ncbi:hypothetical protein LguiA_009972 [Lonicera macranthoides]
MILSMGEGKGQMFEGPCTQLYTKDEDHRHTNTTTSSSSIGSSSSSSETMDDDASSYPGSMYNLSDLMAHLPIKRGLSKYYHGRSQSFTCLSRAKSTEDLAKKVTPYNRREMKACKSYQGGLDSYKSFTHPKAIISKKPSKGSHFRQHLFPVEENVVQLSIIDRL